MIIREFISVVKEMMGIETDDSSFYDQLIYETGRDIRNKLIRQETDRGKFINEGQPYQVKLKGQPFSKIVGSPWVYRSEIDIPSVLDNKSSGKLINLVYDGAGNVYTPTELIHWLNSRKRLYRLSTDKYFMEGEKLVGVTKSEYMGDELILTMDALFENPEELEISKSECLSILDVEFYVPGILLADVKELTRASLMQKYTLPGDRANNDTQDLPQNP